MSGGQADWGRLARLGVSALALAAGLFFAGVVVLDSNERIGAGEIVLRIPVIEGRARVELAGAPADRLLTIKHRADAELVMEVRLNGMEFEPNLVPFRASSSRSRRSYYRLPTGRGAPQVLLLRFTANPPPEVRVTVSTERARLWQGAYVLFGGDPSIPELASPGRAALIGLGVGLVVILLLRRPGREPDPIHPSWVLGPLVAVAGLAYVLSATSDLRLVLLPRWLVSLWIVTAGVLWVRAKYREIGGRRATTGALWATGFHMLLLGCFAAMLLGQNRSAGWAANAAFLLLLAGTAGRVRAVWTAWNCATIPE